MVVVNVQVLDISTAGILATAIAEKENRLFAG
jgi:hypothetical protein